MTYDLNSTWTVSARRGVNGWPSPCVVGWVERLEIEDGPRYYALDFNREHQSGGDQWDRDAGGYLTPRAAADAVFRRAVAQGWAGETTDVTARDHSRAHTNRLLGEAEEHTALIGQLVEQHSDLVDAGEDGAATRVRWRIEDLQQDDGGLNLLVTALADGKPLPDAWLGGAFV